jgi:adenine-specific DNA-methyltransferase
MSETLETEKVPEKLDLASLDIAAEKRAELLRIFPEVRTEGGKIDFARLQLDLGETVDVGKERYGMNWPGKADCFKTIQRPSLGTLLPAREKSVNFDEAENLIIEGDNLEVLKLLQKPYQGKVKLIYIDPPYNTGNDFIYPDNYAESLETYLEYTGQVDSEGRKFSNNTETDGRFHSKWLCMIYPRLYLAQNLLREDGFVVVSIDDAELCNLRAALNEVFGEDNFVAVLVFDRNRKNDAKLFSVGHEYMVVYARNKSLLKERDVKLRAPKEGIEEIREEFNRLRTLYPNSWDSVTAGLRDFYDTFEEDDPRAPLARFTKADEKGPYRTDGDPSWPGGGGPRYDVPHPVTGKSCKVPSRGWVWPTYERMKEEIAAGNVVFGADETTIPSVRRNLFDKDEQVMRSVAFSYAQKATQDFAKIFNGLKVFENPKSYLDMERIVRYLTGPTDIVLDFFAGSGTTAHGTILANRADQGSRQFILVQLPEPISAESDVGRAALSIGCKTVSDITIERVRRVVADSAVEGQSELSFESGLREGFRVFKLATSNFNVWSADTARTTPEALESQLELYINHIKEGRHWEDLLHEILLKSGFPLTTPVETVGIESKAVHSAANGAMLICLDKNLTHEVIRGIADLKPQRVVCLDEAFAGNDELKTNAVLIMKSKGVTKFQTI